MGWGGGPRSTDGADGASQPKNRRKGAAAGGGGERERERESGVMLREEEDGVEERRKFGLVGLPKARVFLTQTPQIFPLNSQLVINLPHGWCADVPPQPPRVNEGLGLGIWDSPLILRRGWIKRMEQIFTVHHVYV